MCIGPWIEENEPVFSHWARVGGRSYMIKKVDLCDTIYINQEDAKHLPPSEAERLFKKYVGTSSIMTKEEFFSAVAELMETKKETSNA